jgi:hypothetical protein
MSDETTRTEAVESFGAWQRAVSAREHAARLHERVASLRIRSIRARENARILRANAARLTFELERAAGKRDAVLHARRQSS